MIDAWYHPNRINTSRLSLRIENFMLVTHDIIKYPADSTVITIHCHSLYNIQWNYYCYYNSAYCLSHLFNTSIINTSCETSQHPLTTMSLMSSRIPVIFYSRISLSSLAIMFFQSSSISLNFISIIFSILGCGVL